MQSNVGGPQIYEAGDQRHPKETGPERGARERRERLEAAPGPGNAHDILDSKDERTLSNKLNDAERRESQLEENKQTVTDPLKPAMDHGNKPSRGAQIDAELQKEEEEMLKKKDKID